LYWSFTVNIDAVDVTNSKPSTSNMSPLGAHISTCLIQLYQRQVSSSHPPTYFFFPVCLIWTDTEAAVHKYLFEGSGTVRSAGCVQDKAVPDALAGALPRLVEGPLVVPSAWAT